LPVLYTPPLAPPAATHKALYDEASSRRLQDRDEMWGWWLSRRPAKGPARKPTGSVRGGSASQADLEGQRSPRGAAGLLGASPRRLSGLVAPLSPYDIEEEVEEEVEEDEEEERILGLWGGIGWLTFVTLLVALCSGYVVETIEEASAALSLPLPFIATIVLPIVGNAAEHASAIIFALKNRMVRLLLFLPLLLIDLWTEFLEKQL
jgi:Ca2+/H+ antiporter